MSEYIMLYRLTDQQNKETMSSPEKAQKATEKWRAWLKGIEDKGHLKSYGQPLERTGKVVAGRSKTVTDGPYAETKDVIGGYSVLLARDIDHAIQLASGCPGLEGGGSVEVRPVRAMP